MTLPHIQNVMFLKGLIIIQSKMCLLVNLDHSSQCNGACHNSGHDVCMD